MPYTNIPDSLIGKMDACVEKVQTERGLDKESAIAICYDSVVAGKGQPMKTRQARKLRQKAAALRQQAEADEQKALVIEDESAEKDESAPTENEQAEAVEVVESVTATADAKGLKCDDMAMPMPMVTSFADYDAYEAAQEQTESMMDSAGLFSMLAQNVLMSPDVTDKGKALAALASEFQARLKIEKDEPTPVAESEDKAGARHSASDQAMLQEIHDHSAKLGAACGLKVLKQTDGNYRWFGWVTNKFRDRDTTQHPKGEIITDSAHKEFIAHLDAHPDSAPEWWTWHTPGTARQARADWWDYADGFLVMSGPATEAEAKAYLANDSGIGMSHGFYALARNRADGLITQYRSFEVSDLPLDYAANQWTSFDMVRKEASMFTPEKRKYLVSKFGEEMVKTLEGNTSLMGKALEALGAEWKESPEPPAQATTQTTATPPADAQLLAAEMVKLLNLPALQKVIVELQQHNKVQAEEVKALRAQIESLGKSEDERVAQTLTPKFQPLQWGFVASQAKETLVTEEDKKTNPALATAPNADWLNAAFNNFIPGVG